MAFALRFGGTQRVQLQDVIFLDGYQGKSWRVEVTVKHDNWPAGSVGFFRGIGATSSRVIKLDTRFRVRTRFENESVSNETGAINFNWVNDDIYTLGIYSTGAGAHGVFRNDTTEQLRDSDRKFDLEFFGDGNTTNFFQGLMYEAKVFIDDVLEHHWINLTGSGNVWTDIVGGNDAVLVDGWPTDDSQWIPIDDGGAIESAVAATWPLFQAVASQSSTVPDITSDIAAQWPIFGVSVSQGAQVPGIDSTIAAAWPLFSVQANQASELPQYQATIATTWPMFSASVSQQSGVPQYTSDLAATWPLFNVNAEQASESPAVEITAALTWPLFTVAANQESQLPEGATSIAVTWPLFSVDASQQSTVPEFDSTIAATWPLLQVSASQQQELPSGATAIAIEWPLFGVQASQESTIPEFTATVSTTWPLFSVSILAGEFDFFASPQARVDIPNLSRRVDIPSLSRRIDI